ncbi:MAG TPA: M1 family metallopeptidase [Polyangiaceae bacterium]|nr:M1 family metallopeptidase [Polyangiaceae bacterium]
MPRRPPPPLVTRAPRSALSARVGLASLASLASLAACAAAQPPPDPAAPGPRATPLAPTAVASTTGATPPQPTVRLPSGVRSVRNAATLTVVPSREVFEGEMTLELEVDAPLSLLWLNADALTLREAHAGEGAGAVKAAIVPGGASFVALSFPQPIAGRTAVHITYEGKLSSTETDGASRQVEDGRPYVFTHFEPLAARRVFPCLDEPAYKAPWQLTLRVKPGDTAVSNTPILSSEEGKDGFTTVRFAETKPLPSYLVAFAVGPFGYVDAGKVGKTPVRIVVPHGKEDWARYAVASTPPVLTELEKYFGGPYPYEKLDLIAVPLFGGAMENPGLVTYRQSLILAKPGTESTGFRRAFASVNAHELAHQWFGDLVTTAWWDDLWLNEAFATWMTPKVIEAYRPEWGASTRRASSASGAMRTDSLVSARQIRQPIASSDDIKNAFDTITYQKGAAVIGMFERWVGAETFQRGVRRYMREHAHGTATSRDFLGAISAEAGRDVSAPFATFLDRPGVPLVEAEVSCAGKRELRLTQSRYLPAGSPGTPAAPPWQIPVCARAGGGTKTDAESITCTLLATEKGALALPSCPAWALPNDGASGYYRVGHSPALLAGLAAHMSRLTPAEKIALSGDVLAAARAGKADLGAFLGLVPALAKDSDVQVVEAALWPVATLRDTPLVTKATRREYATFVQRNFGARARTLGLRAKPNEDENTRWLRPGLVEVVADQGEDPALRAECGKLARAWLTDKNAIEPELVGTVLAIAARFGDRALFDALVREAKTTRDRRDRDYALGALGQFQEPALVSASLALVLDPGLDARETVRLLWSATRLPETVPLAYAFLKDHFDALVARLPRDTAAGFPNVGAAFCDDARRSEIEAFFGPRAARYVGGPRLYAQALENLHLCHTFRVAQEPKVTAFFTKKR